MHAHGTLGRIPDDIDEKDHRKREKERNKGENLGKVAATSGYRRPNEKLNIYHIQQINKHSHIFKIRKENAIIN